MSITSPPRDRRSLAARLALVSTVSLGLVAGPVALAGPASAAPSYGDKDRNCSVTAHDPKKADYGKKDRGYGKFVKVVFKFTIDCKKRAHVHFNHRMFQHHGKWDVEQIGKHRDWVYVKKEATFYKVVKVKADRGEKEVKVSHTVTIKFLDKNKNKKWVWKTDYDRAKAVIELDKGKK